MSKQNYIDLSSTIQVLGGIYLNPNLLEMEEKYFFLKEDFPNAFHKLLFGSMYNLFHSGVTKFNSNVFENYLEAKPKQLAIFQANKGDEYLNELEENTQLSAFDYYYQRFKKFTLLREYDKIGVDCCWLYDTNNISDLKKKQQQDEWLDNKSLDEINEIIKERIEKVELSCVNNAEDDFIQAGDNGLELLEKLKKTPAYGYPFFEPYMNTLTRGARFGKFYLRSASTGVGKSRALIEDACSCACDKIYNTRDCYWQDNNSKEPTLFISTEQTYEEIYTMMLAFVSGVNEEKILINTYEEGEEERVLKANEILSNSPLFIKTLPDFTIREIENCIKIGVKKHRVKFLFYDYIHSSVSILSEIGGRSGVKGLREDQILSLIGVKLKELAVEYDIFIESSTQLNADVRDATIYDEKLLRGAKALADKIDVGTIMVSASQEDLQTLTPLIKSGGYDIPDLKIAFYKNRGNRYNNILVWCKTDKGCCRFTPLFITNYSYEIQPIEDTEIYLTPRMRACAF